MRATGLHTPADLDERLVRGAALVCGGITQRGRILRGGLRHCASSDQGLLHLAARMPARDRGLIIAPSHHLERAREAFDYEGWEVRMWSLRAGSRMPVVPILDAIVLERVR